MKHRSVIILILTALVIGLVVFVSCGLDLGPNPIIGTWEYEQGNYVYKLVFTEDYVQYSYDMYRMTKRRGGVRESRTYEKQAWTATSESGFVSEFGAGTVFPHSG